MVIATVAIMATDQETAREQAPKQLASSWGQITLALAASPLAFASLRILLYSGGDPVVFKTIVRTLDVQSAVVGSLLPLGSVGLGLLGSSYGYYSEFRRRLHAALSGRPVLLGVFVIAVGIVVIVSPYSVLLSTAALIAGHFLGTLIGVIGARRRAKSGQELGRMLKVIRSLAPDKPAGPSVWIVAPVVVTLFLFVTPTGMWLPLERLTDQKGHTDVVYVLDNKGGWMTTIDRAHHINVLSSTSVQSRTICDQGSYRSLAILTMNVHPQRSECK